MSCRARRSSRIGVHPLLEVVPALLGEGDLRGGDLGGPLREDVKQYQQAVRAAVQDPEELPPVVASQLAQLAVDLRAVGERQVGYLVAEQVQSVDLLSEDSVGLVVEGVEEGAHRLVAFGCSVVDGVERGDRSNLDQLMQPMAVVTADELGVAVAPSRSARRHGRAVSTNLSTDHTPTDTHNPKVVGSNPTPATICSRKAQVNDLGLRR